MKRLVLVGLDSLDRKVATNAQVHHFVDEKFKVSVSKPSFGNMTLTTRKGTYMLKRHPSKNIYMGVCGGHKVHVSLKKVVGELRYW